MTFLDVFEAVESESAIIEKSPKWREGAVIEMIADSDSTPSKTSRKFISDHKNVSSFHFIRVQRFTVIMEQNNLAIFRGQKTEIFIIKDRVLIFVPSR